MPTSAEKTEESKTASTQRSLVRGKEQLDEVASTERSSGGASRRKKSSGAQPTGGKPSGEKPSGGPPASSKVPVSEFAAAEDIEPDPAASETTESEHIKPLSMRSASEPGPKMRNLLKQNRSVRNKVDDLLVLANESRQDRTGQDPVAPFVEPERRLRQSSGDSHWKKGGFVELSPGRTKLRHRILPRTVIGISLMLLASAVGVAFSGAAFYAYYDNRLAENENEVSRFVEGFDQQFNDATGAIDELRTEAVEDIRTELKPIEGVVTDADGVVSLPATAGESVWALKTRDDEGAEALGSAFALLDHDEGTLLGTSYALVSASSTAPGPPLELTKGDQTIGAQLWSWDVERDLALLLVAEKLPVLDLAKPAEQTASVGTRVFAMSGFGGQGATASPGVLLDQSSAGLQHTAAVGSMFRGGPILNGSGNVVGLATLTYQPTGVDPGMVLMAPDSAAFCEQILLCATAGDDITLEVPVDSAEVAPEGEDAVTPPEGN